MLFQISSTSSMRSVTGRALKLKVIVFIWTAYNKSELTPRLTGAGARSAQGTNTGHKNGEAMASVGVRVEQTVRPFACCELT